MNAGLCERCVHAHRIPSSKGSVFYLCELSKVDNAFPRYPRLPVIACAGFREKIAPMAEPLSAVRNFRRVDERLLTAGQPNEAQLADAASQGVTTVVNLALHDDPRYSLADEAGCVRGLGMTYVHIPVQFAAPTEQNLLDFFDAMDAHAGETLLVHCAANYRVTAFVGLYRAIRLRWNEERAFETMRSVWEADGVWQRFIAEMLRKHT
jgi:uncharacterized protein (TIGR01244 family)